MNMKCLICVMLGINVNANKVAGSCEKGWMPFDGSCYHFSKNKVTSWYKAMEFCYDNDAYLARVETKEENGFLKLQATIKGGYGYFIDGTDHVKEGNWILQSSQKPMTIFDWADGQPQGGSKENFMVMYKPSLYKWHDTPNSSPNYEFICEKKIKTIQDCCADYLLKELVKCKKQ